MEPRPVNTEAVPCMDVGRNQVVVRRPSAAAQIFGHFTKRAFWIELMEGIVKASVTAFFVALGDTLIRYGRKKGGAENPEIFDAVNRSNQYQSPAAAAFSRSFQPSPSYSPISNPPVPVSTAPSWGNEWPVPK